MVFTSFKTTLIRSGEEINLMMITIATSFLLITGSMLCHTAPVENPSCGRALELAESLRLEHFCSECYDLYNSNEVYLQRTKNRFVIVNKLSGV